jgi:hypothetical protein
VVGKTFLYGFFHLHGTPPLFLVGTAWVYVTPGFYQDGNGATTQTGSLRFGRSEAEYSQDLSSKRMRDGTTHSGEDYTNMSL